jgi:hypothetical protein
VVLAEGRAYASNGTYTTGDFRVQKVARAVRPEGDARDLFSVLAALGNALGVDLPADQDSALGEIARANPAYMDAWNLLVGEGVRQPLPAPGDAVLEPVPALHAGAGLRVITARDLYTALDAAALRHPDAEKLHRYDRIQVSEEDAERLGLRTGDEIAIEGGESAVRAPITVTERVPAGTVFVSSLLQGGAVTALFNEAPVATVSVRAGEMLTTPDVVQVAAATPLAAADDGAPATAAPPPAMGRMRGQSEGDVYQLTGEAIAARLAASGIRWIRELLEQGATPDGRREIAVRAGVEAGMVLEWVNRADLMRVPGVTAEWADLLESAGVDTVKELRTRRAGNLHATLLNAAQTQEREAPAGEAVEAWVTAAQDMESAVEY